MAERPQRRESRQGNENETAFFSFFMFPSPGGPVKRIGDGTGRAIGVFGGRGRERNGGDFSQCSHKRTGFCCLFASLNVLYLGRYACTFVFYILPAMTE